MKPILTFSFFALFITSCVVQEEPDIVIEGLKPVYVTLNQEEIKSLPPRPIEDAGNLLIYKNWLFIVERFKGVHVFDNTTPSNPENIAFINIPGVSQLTLDANTLFVNFEKDLLLLDISDIHNVVVVESISNFYNGNNSMEFPENYQGYFECVDNNLGNVVAWEKVALINPKCLR